MNIWGITNTGSVRQQNQDAYRVEPLPDDCVAMFRVSVTVSGAVTVISSSCWQATTTDRQNRHMISRKVRFISGYYILMFIYQSVTTLR